MARIPLPGVQTNPMTSPAAQAPGVRAMQDATAAQLGGLGKATQSAGEGLSRVGDYLQDQVDDARVTEAVNRFADVERRTLMDPKTGYLAKVGKDAVTSYDETTQSLTEIGERLEGSLDNSIQKAMFRKQRMHRNEQNFDRMAAHRLQQADAWKMGETRTLLDTNVNDYVAAWQEPGDLPGAGKRRAMARGQALQNANNLADLAGLSPDSPERAALMAKVEDRLHKGVVEQFIDQGRALDAKDYLGSGVNISASLKAELQKDVRVAATKEEGANLASALVARGGSLPERLASLEEVFTKGRMEVDDPEAVFEEALKRLTAHDKVLSAEQARQRSTAWDQVEEYATQHAGILDSATEKILRDTNQEDRYRLWTSQGKHLFTTDFGNAALTTMTPQELRQKYATVEDLQNAYRFELTREGLGQLTNRWRSGEEKAPKQDKAIVLADGLRQALGKDRDADLDKNLVARWENSVNSELATLMAKKPGTSEDAHLREAMDNAGKRGFFLDASGKKFRLDLAATKSEIEGAYVQMPDGGFVDAPVDLIVPGTKTTYREAVDAAFNLQASQDWPAKAGRPAKPRGFVLLRGEAVSRDTISYTEVVRLAAGMREADNADRRSTHKEWLQGAYRAELQKVIERSGRRVISLEGDATSFEVPAGKADEFKAEALRAVFAREDEWRHFGFNSTEVSEALGETPEQRFKRLAPKQGPGMRAGSRLDYSLGH